MTNELKAIEILAIYRRFLDRTALPESLKASLADEMTIDVLRREFTEKEAN